MEVPNRALVDGDGFRIRDGVLTNANVGRVPYTTKILNGAVVLIDTFFLRGGAQVITLGTPTDLYQYDDSSDTITYITPVYVTGTASASGTTVTGSGTLWDTAPNVRKNALPGDEISFGANDENDPDATWYEIETVDSDTQLTLTASAGTVGSGTYTLRRRFGGDVFDYWRAETFPDAQPDDEDLWIATNGGVDYPIQWNGTDDFCTLRDDIGFRAKELIRKWNQMLFFNITLDSGEAKPTTVRTSSFTKPFDYTISEGSAELDILNGVDPIVGVYSLGDALAVYGERSVTLQTFTNSTVQYLFRLAISGLGPITGRAVADFGDFHRFRAADGEYEFDGVSIREVGSHLWNGVIPSEDPVRTTLINAHFDEENRELLWIVPRTVDENASNGTAQPERAFAEHYAEDVGDRTPVPYSTRKIKCTATGFAEKLTSLRFSDINEPWSAQNFRWNERVFKSNFPINIIGDENGNLYELNQGGGFDTGTFGSELITNGTFDSDINGWTDVSPASGSGSAQWTASQALELTGAADDEEGDPPDVISNEAVAVTDAIAVTGEARYRLTWTANAAATAYVNSTGSFMGPYITTYAGSSSGTKTIEFYVPAGVTAIYVFFGSKTTTEIDDVSLTNRVINEVTSFVRFSRQAPGGGEFKTFLRRIYPYTRAMPAAAYDLTVKLWSALQADGRLRLARTMSFNLRHEESGYANEHFVSPHAAVRFFELQFETIGINKTWTLAGWHIAGDAGPER